MLTMPVCPDCGFPISPKDTPSINGLVCRLCEINHEHKQNVTDLLYLVKSRFYGGKNNE